MRSSILTLFTLALTGVQASWFESDTPSSSQLLKDDYFNSWDDSRLREFLLEQGIVPPSGPRDQLVLLAKQKYTTAYSPKTASDIVSSIAATAVAQATNDVIRKLDDNKDYVYSSWDDSKMKKFLQDKGKESSTAPTHQELLKKMTEVYANAGDPVWNAWSDSYMVCPFPLLFCIIALTLILFQREWLLSHNIIPESYDAKRASYSQMLKHYYYSLSDTVWTSWTDMDLKAWLVTNGCMKSDEEMHREKMLKLVNDNYVTARDTFWNAWSDGEIRKWLVENGYMRSDAQSTRDELVKSINDKYTDASARTAGYLVWPDARLRAYLRERGVSEKALPTSRPGLLQETRIRWVQTTNHAETLYNTLRDRISSGVTSTKDTFFLMLKLLWSMADKSKKYANDKTVQWKRYVDRAREKTGDKIKYGGERIRGGL